MIDIKEVAKTMTREEFIKEASKFNFGIFHDEDDCPTAYKLPKKPSCTGFCADICKECWRNAVKDIKFKDDMEVEKVSKKLNIIEAMKMPIGTEFEVLLNGDKFGCVAKILKLEGNSKKQLVWDNRANSSIVLTDSVADAVLIKIQQPVSFMEVVNSDKKCKVDFSNIGLPNHWDARVLKFKNKNYITFGQLMYDLSNTCGTDVLRKIFKEAKWYVEESEDDSNDIR